jgi:hypothetical protein
MQAQHPSVSSYHFSFFKLYPPNEYRILLTLVELVEKFWPSYESVLLNLLARQPARATISMMNLNL